MKMRIFTLALVLCLCLGACNGVSAETNSTQDSSNIVLPPQESGLFPADTTFKELTFGVAGANASGSDLMITVPDTWEIYVDNYLSVDGQTIADFNLITNRLDRTPRGLMSKDRETDTGIFDIPMQGLDCCCCAARRRLPTGAEHVFSEYDGFLYYVADEKKLADIFFYPNTSGDASILKAQFESCLASIRID